MDKRTHQIIAGGYVIIGVFSMIAFSFMSGSGFTGFMTGLLLIIGSALGHEYMIRRDGFSKVARGVIGLRETVDRSEGAVTRMKAEFDKTVNDARAAKEAMKKLQDAQKELDGRIKELGEQGGGGQVQEAIQQLYGQQQQTNQDIEIIQNAGNQLHTEFQTMQQQIQQMHANMQQMQNYMQQSLEQMHSSVNAALAAGAMAAAAPAAQPAPPPEMPAPPEPAPAPEPQPVPEPVADAPAPAAPEAVPEAPEPAVADPAPAAAAEMPSDPAPAPAAGGGGFTATVISGLQSQIGQLGDGPADASLRAIAEGLINDAVDLYVEPIVTLPERKPAFYECYGGVRGADGSPLTLDPDLDLSGRDALMAAIENALMVRCLDRIAALDVSGISDGQCFYNVPGVTLADRVFFGGLLGDLQARSDLAGRLVMEFSQSALMENGEKAVEDLVRLQEAGCNFSIDEITDLAIDFESLVGFGFRFVKVGSKFIRGAASSADDPDSVRGLAKTLKAMNIDVVVENVETDLSLVELIAFDILYGQGALFGQPAVMPS